MTHAVPQHTTQTETPAPTAAVGLVSRARDHGAALVFLSATALATLITLLRDRLLPERFSYDAAFIRAVALGSNRQVAGESYGSIGLLYRLTGLAENEVGAGLLSLAVFLALIAAGARQVAYGKRAVYLILCSPAIVLAGVFYGTHNKDFIVGLIVLLSLVRRPRRLDWVLVAAMLGYGMYFRQYWLLVAAFYVGVTVMARKPLRRGQLVILVVSAAVAMVLAFNVVLGVDVDHFRMMVNASRIGSPDAQTAIGRFFAETSLAGQSVNCLLAFVAVLTWFPLALHGSLFYYAAIALMVPMNLLMIRAWMHGNARLVGLGSTVALWVSFVFVQAVFEPDFGSLLRHTVVFIPAMLAVIVTAGLPRRNVVEAPSSGP